MLYPTIVPALKRVLAKIEDVDFDYAEVVLDWIRGNEIDTKYLMKHDNRKTTKDTLYRKIRLSKDDFQAILDGKILKCPKDYESWSHGLGYDIDVGDKNSVVVTFKKKIPEKHQILDIPGYFDETMSLLEAKIKTSTTKDYQSNDLLIKMKNMYDDLVGDEMEVITKCQPLSKKDIYQVQHSDKEKALDFKESG